MKAFLLDITVKRFRRIENPEKYKNRTLQEKFTKKLVDKNAIKLKLKIPLLLQKAQLIGDPPTGFSTIVNLFSLEREKGVDK